ncbi:MAG TPA: prenyltransferase/squalene oxidase repeat-containing protein [Gemmataceae bacterium]|jgi:geranylgeranyl transferase type-2 subunit beta|nr:prenyltransferase/squalene oxidase repeat-containing protein [Gemmataceae bacterium]
MSNDPYLQRLTGQLIDGADRLPLDFRQRHGAWVRARQNSDGGFSGREGGSDLYYTGFALRSLAVVQELDSRLCDRAADFLRGQMTGSASVIDLFSLLVSAFLTRLGGGPDVLAEAPADWPSRVATVLETFRHEDGGYAKTQNGTSGSTYITFLVALALELLGKSCPEPGRLRSFLQNRYRDGGFVEIPQMKRAGTNPTAAGVGTLQMLGGLEEGTRIGVADFLVRLASVEGGLRANDRIPAADLLSTFTGAWTLAEVGGLHRLDLARLGSYAASLAGPDGGFRGGLWDTGYDVEYTFYGIGVLALLATE